ncbi:hypothetical protein SASPL_157967 [Salvia splendens]|uniref:Retrotransposon gag domain-containing protein n=1 Tax=Salvia splendens TaxID=180675 RepID=A0A8X8YUM7_SALSN|nr:hypothetical protein SASPL_157967 [Salvia splendens]
MADDSVVGNLCGHDHGDGPVPMRDCSLLRRLEQHFDLRFDATQMQIEGVSRRLDVLEVGVGSTGRTERIRREDGRRLRRESRVDVSSDETSDGLEESVNESASIQRNNRMRDLRRGRGGDRHVVMERDCERPRKQRTPPGFRLKIDILTFDGTLNIEGFLDWVAEVDRFFEHTDVQEKKRASMVACRLKGEASAWWDRTLQEREELGKARQGTRSVHEYTCGFNRLTTRNKLLETMAQKVARYLDGLKPQIRNKIGIQAIHSLRDAKGFALKAEQMIQ